jgi:starch synthase
MKILFIASEVDGLVKTGGLADVAYALPKALIAAGHDVRIVLPAYRMIQDIWSGWPKLYFSTKVNYYTVENVEAYQGEHESIPVTAINHAPSFDRNGIYDEPDNGYDDNAYRYAVFSKAALDWCKLVDFQPDIVHTNDWQASLACFYLAEHHAQDDFFAKTRTVLSIHNGAYQMHCEPAWLEPVGIDSRFFNPSDFEDFAHLNILKGAIGFADGVTTVSPGYADELLSPTGGHGIDFKYRELTRPLQGILNGCDYDQWNPETDPWIIEQFSSAEDPGKAQCKKALQQELKLDVDPNIPLLGVICRLTDQKGIHLLIPVILELMKTDECQVAMLGSGDATMANQLEYIQRQYPHRFHFVNGYDVGLSHRIEAGSDAFLMPSVFEPCGLNQIYSLRYGTIPLVREVGGLQDTVCRLSNSERNLKTATGFMFSELSSEALLAETQRMLKVYRNKPAQWKAMQRNGMAKRFNWKKAATQYQKLYKELLSSPKVQHPLAVKHLDS